MFDPTLTEILNGGSGLLLVAVALLVFAVAPRERGNLAFAVMISGWGIRQFGAYAGSAFTEGDTSAAPLFVAAMVGTAILVVGLVLVAVWFPSRWSRAERHLAVFPLVVLAVMVLPVSFVLAVSEGVLLGQMVGSVVLGPGFVFLSMLSAMRYRSLTGGEMGQRFQHVMLTLAYMSYAGVSVGSVAVGAPTHAIRLATLPQVLGIVVVAGLWLRAAAEGESVARRTARNLSWFVLGALLVGMLAEMPTRSASEFHSGPQFGVARFFLVGVLAYAVLRHQLLGIDMKVRWTISRSTIAAAFVAAFFIASEGAQLVFGQRNQWVGLLAAGALVFAIAPLQRAADRFAARAVPPSASPPSAAGEEAYRNAVLLALRDRRLTREEEIRLFRVAQTLGVPAGRAMEIQHEMEQQTQP